MALKELEIYLLQGFSIFQLYEKMYFRVMKIAIITFTLLFSALITNAQEFADNKFYLIDSLDLSKVEPTELELLEKSLKEFHKEKNDTNKIKALTAFIENSWDDNLWPRYNFWLKEFSEKKLNQKPKQLTKLFLKKSQS